MSSGQTNAASPTPGWVIVFEQGVRELWFGGRGLVLMVAFSLLLSILSYLAATNEELNLLDQKDTVNLIVQAALAVGIALSLLLSADAVSGERERDTLETLLLTPVPRRQIAIGKLLVAITAWPAIMAVTVPYVWILRAGSGLFVDAVVASVIVGTLLAIAFSSLGLIVSMFSNSNRLSLAVSFFVFVALVLPTQVPLKGWLGETLIRINPMTAGARFMDRIIVNNHTFGQEWTWLLTPVLAALLAASVVVILAGHLQLRARSGG